MTCCCSLAGTIACMTCPNRMPYGYNMIPWPQYTPYYHPISEPIDYDLLAKKITDLLKEKKEG